MKKKLLFVIDSLRLGGAEKSLVTLLNLIDYSKYDVDLQLFSYDGLLQKLLPKEVNLLEPLAFFTYSSISYKHIMKKIRKPKFLLSQIRYSIHLRCKQYNNIQKAIIMWKETNSVFESYDINYDVAIAYAQGVPTFYVGDKVKAKMKIGWINATYIPTDGWLSYVSNIYEKFDKINTVSETTKEQFVMTFKKHEKKAIVIKDIIDFQFLLKMSQFNDIDKSFKEYKGLRILTVGRLVYSKGYDLAVEACKLLQEKKIDFKWFVIGEGDQKEFIKEKIIKNNLENYFILLGSKSNPYPYFKFCDIYVQTSRFEGFGITLSEARMFNKPIVTTDFDAVYSQMKPNQNGMIVSQKPESIANGVIKILKDDNYRNSLICFLEKEKKGNTEEINKFYSVINENKSDE